MVAPSFPRDAVLAFAGMTVMGTAMTVQSPNTAKR